MKVTFVLEQGAPISAGSSSSKTSSLGPSSLKMLRRMASVKQKETFQSSARSQEKKKKSSIEEIMESEEERKRKPHTEYWLQPKITVKIRTNNLAVNSHQKNGVDMEVINKYTAIVKLIDSRDQLKLYQSPLETGNAGQGKIISVLNASYRGNEGTLESISEKTFSSTVFIETGPFKRHRMEGIKYEGISKLA